MWKIDWYQNECPYWPLFRGRNRIKVTSTTALHSTLNISKTVTDRGLVPNGPPIGNGICFQRSLDRWRYVTLKGQTRDHESLIRLERNISKTAGDKRVRSKELPIGNGIWSIKWSFDTPWPMTSRDPQRCCEAVRSDNPSDSLASVIFASNYKREQHVAATTWPCTYLFYTRRTLKMYAICQAPGIRGRHSTVSSIFIQSSSVSVFGSCSQTGGSRQMSHSHSLTDVLHQH